MDRDQTIVIELTGASETGIDTFATLVYQSLVGVFRELDIPIRVHGDGEGELDPFANRQVLLDGFPIVRDVEIRVHHHPSALHRRSAEETTIDMMVPANDASF